MVFTGCASVTVKKIPSPVDYTTWTDKQQAEADKIEGFRFPEIRPFFVIAKEYPTAGKTMFVRGKLALDGRLLSLDVRDVEKVKDWGMGALTALEHKPEVYISRNSSLVKGGTPDGSAESAVGGAAGKTPQTKKAAVAMTTASDGKPKPYSLAGAVAVTPSTPLHVDRASRGITVTLTVTAATLGTTGLGGAAGLGLDTIRGLYLVPVVDSKAAAVEQWIPLPMALYDASNGTLVMKGAMISKLKKGSYVYGAQFLKIYGDTVGESYVYCPPEKIQLAVDVGWDPSKGPELGEDASTTTAEPERVITDGIAGFNITTSSGRSPDVIAGPSRKVDLNFTVGKGADLKRVIDGKTMSQALGTDVPNVGAITGMGLVPKAADSEKPDFTQAVRLPFTTTATAPGNGTVDFIGLVDYDHARSKKLSPGSYYLAAWVTTKSSAGTAQTTPVYSERTEFTVSDAGDFKLPDPIKAPVVTPAKPATPAPAPLVKNKAQPGSGKTDAEDSSAPNDVAPGSVNLPGGHASAVLSGDPTSGPLVSVNDYFSILMLPDRDHQYAVQAKAGWSDAAVDIAPKYGWLVERFNSRVDNKAIGAFFFKQIDKTLDLARDLVKVHNGLLAPILGGSSSDASSGTDAGDGSGSGTPDGTAESKTTADKAGKASVAVLPREAIFRLHFREIALPGIYPILDVGELRRADPTTYAKRLVEEPRALLRVATRTEVVVELISFAGNSSSPSQPAPEHDLSGVEKFVRELAAGDDFKELKIVKVDPAQAGTIVQVTKPDGTAADEVLARKFQNALNQEIGDRDLPPFTVKTK